MRIIIALVISSTFLECSAQNKPGQDKVFSRLVINERLGKKDSVANWTLHAQLTAIYQYHPAFRAAYSGVNSLNNNAEGALSLTTTIYAGRKLWKGATLYFNPELTGGLGLSHTLGMAGFPNGEIYRVGSTTPTPFVARLYLQQVISLGHGTCSFQESDANQLAGRMPESRVVITAGRFGVSDFFDGNTYNHDARSQFINWSLMANGSWDFPADTRGYTYGLVAELIKPKWAIRAATVLEPVKANGLAMDIHYDKVNSETLEGEEHWNVLAHPGLLRATAYLSFTRAPAYSAATYGLLHGDSTLENVVAGLAQGNTFGGIKYGFGINVEQEMTHYLGLFLRANWSDGHTATWAFSEIDNNLQFGLNLNGKPWLRPLDHLGLAFASNGLSKDHEAYLAAGGRGLILGDGRLNYGRENIAEAFYNAKVASFLEVTFDYQFALFPGYNRDRGPVHIIAARVHIEI